MKYYLLLFLPTFYFGFAQIEINGNAQFTDQRSNKTNLVVDDSVFVNLKDYSNDFYYDIRYATANNFLKAKVYECEECYLRYATVKALLLANRECIKLGYKINIFDCYRPLDIQKKMWKIVPNPNYVADPAKGSIHNRGGAVDITLVDAKGNALDMGTDFDFFGIKASHSYKNLPNAVLKNRILLKKIMLKSGFSAFESEWWHYNLRNTKKMPVSNFVWECH